MTLWQKGKSANPGGRPRGYRGLAAIMRDYFGDGAEVVVEQIRKVLLDEKTPAQTRLAAAQLILDRQFGKPVQPVELEVTEGNATADAVDMRLLTDEELAAWAACEEKLKILRATARARAALPPAPPIEVTPIR